MLNQNSLEAHEYLLKHNIKNQRYSQIIDLLGKFKYLTTKEISEKINMPINCVSGRITELKDKLKLVKEVKKIKNEYNRNVSCWGLAGSQLDLI